jgi:hypothetical protein
MARSDVGNMILEINEAIVWSKQSEIAMLR